MKLDSLSRDITQQEVAQFLRNHPKARNKFPIQPYSIVLLVVIFLIMLVSFFSSSPDILSLVVIMSLMSFGIGAFIIYFVGLYKQMKVPARRGVLLERLAKENNWDFLAISDDRKYPGTLFTKGYEYVYRNIILNDDFEIGQCFFVTGSGRNRQQHSYGYMIMQLDRHMPHILLDSKSNNLKIFGQEFSNVAGDFRKEQIVSLEGDFDKYYTLYAPNDYGYDVRYIFTPDLMQLLVEESASTDIEIIDDKVFVYLGQYEPEKIAFWQRIDKFRNISGGKLLKRAGRYEDERTPDGSISKKAVRLRRGTSIFVWLLIAIYLWSIISKMLG